MHPGRRQTLITPVVVGLERWLVSLDFPHPLCLSHFDKKGEPGQEDILPAVQVLPEAALSVLALASATPPLGLHPHSFLSSHVAPPLLSDRPMEGHFPTTRTLNLV